VTRLARVLVIAGSDSGGGAGIQADIKTLSALGVYAATAITAITVQNTLGVTGIHVVPPQIVAGQITAVMQDIGADCIKIGMLGNEETIHAVADALAACAADIPLVLDPVMVAKGGAHLLEDAAVSALKARLLPRATVLTPNIPEAETLTGAPLRDLDAMARTGEALLAMGCGAVYMKGGHMDGAQVRDMLVTAEDETVFEAPRIDTPHTHGTGCTLASAIAAGLAQGMALIDASARAHDYVRAAIERAPSLGQGHGPLNHLITVEPFHFLS
jgi:hydroxymethylpyrimidine/phosphomethylpyrimidine kinase